MEICQSLHIHCTMSNLLLLIFLAWALAGRSWSLGGWELHDFRRTGVFIDLSCCFDIIFTSLQPSFVSTLYQPCIFLCSFFSFLSIWQNVRTSLASPSWYLSPHIVSISFQLFLFHPNSDGRTLTCVYSFQKTPFSSHPGAIHITYFFFFPFLTVLYLTLPTLFYSFSSPTSLNLVFFSFFFFFYHQHFICKRVFAFFLIGVFLDGILSFSFTCLPIFSLLFSSHFSWITVLAF